jgi:protein subunit release factor A
MTILDQYLHELFFGLVSEPKNKYTSKDGKPELFGFSLTYTSDKDKGKEICKELEDDTELKIKEDNKKCSRIPINTKEREICEIKNKIKRYKEFSFDLRQKKYLCKHETICEDSLNKRYYDLTKEIREYEKDLKELLKSTS